MLSDFQRSSGRAEEAGTRPETKIPTVSKPRRQTELEKGVFQPNCLPENLPENPEHRLMAASSLAMSASVC